MARISEIILITRPLGVIYATGLTCVTSRFVTVITRIGVTSVYLHLSNTTAAGECWVSYVAVIGYQHNAYLVSIRLFSCS